MFASIDKAKAAGSSSGSTGSSSGTSGASGGFTRRDVTAADHCAPQESVWCTGGPYAVALQGGTSGQRYQVTNANFGGGAAHTITVPTGAKLEGTLNGTLAVPAGLSYTFETDGTNFIIV